MTVSYPGDPGYDEATQVFNLIAPAKPAAAVTARTVDEVRAALRHAAEESLPVRVHTTGHASAAVRPVDGSLLVRTRIEGEVQIDTERRIARVPAGTTWGAVVTAAARHGLAAPHGSAGTVGVVGYLLRGGMSFYGRDVGLAVNSVRAIELVTADGELRRVSADQDQELFWALRGGGGGFGVVTAIEVALFPASQVVTGVTFWPAAYAPELLSTWLRWCADAPAAATTSIRVMNLPPLPDLPPELTAGPVFGVDGAVRCADGDVAAGELIAAELLEPLRAIAAPVSDSWRPAPTSAVLEVHMDPDEPLPVVGEHMLLGDLGDEGAAEFLRVVGAGSGSPFVVAGLRQLGGRYAEPDPAGGVLNHLTASYAYAGSGLAATPEQAHRLRAHCDVVRTALTPWDTGRTVPCFVERFEQPQGHLSDVDIQAVDRVRARVDPTGRFSGDVA
ncbi:FAD-binding oxidoreductase [Actinophytocola gossypii]|uniref:FAD-binding oxidoreductase n=1 Tax=Actinophytocola gossypii TaxID=2812003 RepID=A0ABT2JG53_9PSEU|nr:FAD-binding protein [Actinophytocola gossypii]MCT2586828.1 FAD-binding oxidoreductase [Actinophytocola gossypii]